MKNANTFHRVQRQLGVTNKRSTVTKKLQSKLRSQPYFSA